MIIDVHTLWVKLSVFRYAFKAPVAIGPGRWPQKTFEEFTQNRHAILTYLSHLFASIMCCLYWFGLANLCPWMSTQHLFHPRVIKMTLCYSVNHDCIRLYERNSVYVAVFHTERNKVFGGMCSPKLGAWPWYSWISLHSTKYNTTRYR